MNNEFKKELYQLLTKYNVTICFSVSACSDTYGLSDEAIVFSDKQSNELLRVDGWCVSQSDLREEDV